MGRAATVGSLGLGDARSDQIKIFP